MWFRKKPIVVATYHTGDELCKTKRKRMKRPPALYVVYAKSRNKYYCGFPFAELYGNKFHGFRFENYKRAIEYTRRFRSEEAANNQVKRFEGWYNVHRKDKIIFKTFKVEADETWEAARERWFKEYTALEVKNG